MSNKTSQRIPNRVSIEKVEFQLSNGSVIVFIKEARGWTIIKYIHGHQSKHVRAIGCLPNMANALHFDKELKCELE